MRLFGTDGIRGRVNAHPMTSFDNPKMPPSSTGPKISSIFARMANVSEVTRKAKQLPRNNLVLLKFCSMIKIFCIGYY